MAKSRLRRRAEQTECPYCFALPGEPCSSLSEGINDLSGSFHIQRYDLAKKRNDDAYWWLINGFLVWSVGLVMGLVLCTLLP